MDHLATQSENKIFPFKMVWKLTAAEREEIRCVVLDVVPAVIKQLDGLCPGAASVYGVQNWLINWIELGYINYSDLPDGMIFTVLDYHYNHKKTPKQNRWYRGSAAAHLKAQLWQHHLVALKASATNTLFQLTMLYLLPDLWLSDSMVEQSIKRQLKAIREVKVETVEVQLNFPFNRAAWLAHKNRGEWLKLKERIDTQGPWPLTLTDRTLDPFRQKMCLAWAYREMGDEQILLDVYEPGKPGEKIRLLVDLKQQHFELAGLGFEGWFCEAYVPQPPCLKSTTCSKPFWFLKWIWKCLQFILKIFTNKSIGYGKC